MHSAKNLSAGGGEMNWRCMFGLHLWRQNRPLDVLDGFPPSHLEYETPKRICQRCHQEQSWLPGYGGSEWGCWMETARSKARRRAK